MRIWAGRVCVEIETNVVVCVVVTAGQATVEVRVTAWPDNVVVTG